MEIKERPPTARCPRPPALPLCISACRNAWAFGNKGFVLSCSCWFHLVAHMARFPPSWTHGSPGAPVAACRTTSGGHVEGSLGTAFPQAGPRGTHTCTCSHCQPGEGLVQGRGAAPIPNLHSPVGPSAPPHRKGAGIPGLPGATLQPRAGVHSAGKPLPAQANWVSATTCRRRGDSH